MAGDLSIRSGEKLLGALQGDAAKKLSASQQNALRQQQGVSLSTQESVTISAEGVSLSRSTSVTMTLTRQSDVYSAPPASRPQAPSGAGGAGATEGVANRLTAAEVAKNVLTFVEDRLKREQASGASQERLTNLLKQARSGIDKGYDEAKAELKDRNLLTEELDADIEKGKSRIEAGLDKLAEKYLGQGESENPEQAKPEKDARPADVDKPRESAKPRMPVRNPLSEAVAVERASLAEASMGIQVRTRDGDIVTLSATQLNASFYSRDSESETEGVFESGGYQFSVEGELDEDEMRALEDLVGQVQGMAEQFFGGDFSRAFESALQLNADPSEIASFAVSLSSRQVEQVSNRYGSQDGGGNASARYAPLADQADRMREALGTASPFDDRAHLIQQMIETFTRQKEDTSRQLDQYLEFTRQLAARIEQNMRGDEAGPQT